MADKFTIKITGIRGARRKLAALAANLQEESADDMAIRVKDIEREAKRIVPKDTANLQRTITSEVEIKVGKIQGLVGANTKYALPLEAPKGRDPRHRSRKGFIGRMTAFLLPALTRLLRAIVKGQEKAVKRAVRKT